MKRRIVVLLIILVAIPVMGVVSFPLWFPAAARNALQVAGTRALGVDVRLDGIDVAILDGRASMSGLTIANPEGFRRDRFLSMGSGSFRVDLGSEHEKLVIPEIRIDDLVVNLEEGAPHANWEVILRNIDEYVGPPDPQAKDSATGYLIERVLVTNIRAEYRASVAGILKPAVRVDIEELVLKDIADDKPPKSGEIIAVLVREILRGIGRAAVGLPKTVVTGLVKGVGGVLGGVAKVVGLGGDDEPPQPAGEKGAKRETEPAPEPVPDEEDSAAPG